MALLRVQHSAYKKPSSSWSASVLAEYQRNVPSRRTFTRFSFFNFSRWCERVELGISSSLPISPTIKPSGCAEKKKLHDPQPGFCSHGRKHIGIADYLFEVFFLRHHALPYFYI